MSRERLHSTAALVLALAFLAQAWLGSLDESLTWDEPGYIAAGYANWTWGDYRLNADHPPLMQKLQALPLVLLGVAAPPVDAPRYLGSPNPRPTYGYDLFFRSGNDVERLTRFARAPGMLLGALLVLCVYAWGRELFGSGPALLPTALAALCPNLIAHAKLATEDLGCALGLFAAVFALWRAVRDPRPRRVGACAAATGLALLTKYTALLLVPAYAALGLAAAAAGAPRRRLLASLAAVALGAFAVVGLGYGLRFRPDLYWEGIFRIYPDVSEDYAFTLLGRFSERPFWYHALVSLAIKVPLPTWIALGVAAAVAIRARRRSLGDAFLLVPPALVLGASCFDATNPGIRRVLPALPFLLLFAGRALEGAPGRARRAALALCTAWLALEAALIFPHHLSYLNQAVGGPERGPWVTDESNIDWGQDLPALAAWQREHGAGEPLYLLYFGSADPAAYGVRARELDRERLERPTPGLYAISAHYLAWLRKLRALRGEGVDWLERYRPLARAGYSIFLYRMPPGAEEAGDSSRSRRARAPGVASPRASSRSRAPRAASRRPSSA